MGSAGVLPISASRAAMEACLPICDRGIKNEILHLIPDRKAIILMRFLMSSISYRMNFCFQK
jgi:thymidylate kinase